MQRFGQEVRLVVTNGEGGQVLDASGLRVDFELYQIRGFNRASVKVYNLTDATIGSLVGVRDRFATLSVRLHGGSWFTLIDGFYINNSIDEVKLPDRITTLYMYDGIKKKILEQHVSVVVVNPTLQRMVDQVLNAGARAGSATPPNTRYQSFPVNLEDYELVPAVRNLEGSVQMCMKQLEMEFDFNMYTEKDGILMVYKPHLSQVGDTDLDQYGIVQLDTNNMRANPILAPAQLQVNSNLDTRIKPGAVLDISQLLTAAPGSPEITLQLADQFARESLAGYSRYQSLTVIHKGSNYTAQWNTQVTAVSPTNGTVAPVGASWFK